MILLHTGCRTNEAAYVVHNMSIEDNDYYFPHDDCMYIAFVPAEFTKTNSRYIWNLPSEMNDIIDIILS